MAQSQKQKTLSGKLMISDLVKGKHYTEKALRRASETLIIAEHKRLFPEKYEVKGAKKILFNAALKEAANPVETRFQQVVNSRIERTRHLLLVKGQEYVRNDNRYHNFDTTARIAATTPERALDGFLLKQYTSYRDILDDIENGRPVSAETVKEKFGDIIVYMHIQEAMILERLERNKAAK